MKYISPQIYIYLQSVQAYIAPPIAACFLLGVLFPRLNGTGALAALWTGLVLGTARLVLELARASLASGSVWYWFATINFLHFAALLFVLCSGSSSRSASRPRRPGLPGPPADGRGTGDHGGPGRIGSADSQRGSLDCPGGDDRVLWIVFR